MARLALLAVTAILAFPSVAGAHHRHSKHHQRVHHVHHHARVADEDGPPSLAEYEAEEAHSTGTECVNDAGLECELELSPPR